jgi:hypothetical protein
MARAKTLDDLIALWPSVAAFGEDAGSGLLDPKPVRANHVHTIKARKKLPSEYWPGIIAGAKARGIRGITAELLLEIQTHMAETA